MNDDPVLKGRIVALVDARPGSTMHDLTRGLAGSDRGTVSRRVLRHRLRALVADGAIATARSGRSRHYYSSRGPWMDDLETCAFLQSGGRWPVAFVLAREPSLTIPEIRQRLAVDRNPWQLRFLLRSLAAKGLVAKGRRGSSVVYEPSSRLRRAVASLVANVHPAKGVNPRDPTDTGR